MVGYYQPLGIAATSVLAAFTWLQALLEWLNAEEPLSEPQLTHDDATRLAEQGSSTSVDLHGKHTAAQTTFRGRDEPPILEPNAKRIRGWSEPWKMSSAHTNWFKPKKSAAANEKMALLGG